MNVSKKRKRPGHRVMILFLKSIVPLLAMILVNTGTAVSATKEAGSEKLIEKGLVLNLAGRDIGVVDSEGNVYNRYEKFIGSIDEKGNIYNVSKIRIGTVNAGGEVRNQAGTLLGYADEQGNVYNRLGTKVGSVEGIGGLILVGGAARLLFFTGR